MKMLQILAFSRKGRGGTGMRMNNKFAKYYDNKRFVHGSHSRGTMLHLKGITGGNIKNKLWHLSK